MPLEDYGDRILLALIVTYMVIQLLSDSVGENLRGRSSDWEDRYGLVSQVCRVAREGDGERFVVGHRWWMTLWNLPAAGWRLVSRRRPARPTLGFERGDCPHRDDVC